MTQAKMITIWEGKIVSKEKLTRKTEELLIPSESITRGNMLHCMHMGRNSMLVITLLTNSMVQSPF